MDDHNKGYENFSGPQNDKGPSPWKLRVVEEVRAMCAEVKWIELNILGACSPDDPHWDLGGISGGPF